MSKLLNSAVLFGLAVSAGAALAAPPETPSWITRLGSCKTLPDRDQRLACYEAKTAELEQAIAQRQLVVIDREGVRQTRRTLFGFNNLRIPFLSDGDKEGEEEQELSSTIVSARDLGYGKWQIRLQDGGVWNTLEANESMKTPRAGMPVLIRRGAMNSYLLKVDGQRALRARRQN